MKPPRRISEFDVELAVKTFFNDPDWMFKMGIGGVVNAGCLVVTLINPLLMPISMALTGLVNGYVLRLMRFQSVNPKSNLPDWNDWPDLFISGITWLAIEFGLMLVPISVTTIAVMLGAVILEKNTALYVPFVIGAVLVAFLTVTFTTLIGSFLMVNFAIEEKLSAGFAVRKASRLIFKNFPICLTAFLLAMGLQVVAVVLPAITVLGIFIIPSALFAAQLVSAIMLAQAWAVSEGKEKAGKEKQQVK